MSRLRVRSTDAVADRKLPRDFIPPYQPDEGKRGEPSSSKFAREISKLNTKSPMHQKRSKFFSRPTLSARAPMHIRMALTAGPIGPKEHKAKRHPTAPCRSTCQVRVYLALRTVLANRTPRLQPR